MLTGWTKPFKINRPITTEERRAALSHHRQSGIIPDASSSLLRFNSTYSDFIDRSFRLRGMVITAFGSLLLAGMLALYVWLVGFIFLSSYRDGYIEPAFLLLSISLISVFFLGGIVAILKFHFSKEFFTYTHYPRRFNRKTRQVHVFRHNGPGGVLTVPFDDVFWHIGRGYQEKFLCDVRGHVMEGDTVRDTFAVGYYFDDEKIDRIQSIWEFIRRYMDEGPETVAEHPFDRLIDESAAPTLMNCFIHAYTNMGPGFVSLRYPLFFLFYPIVGLLTLTRWLVFKTCKIPVWPSEIEAESLIEPNDPHQWEEPRYIAEFAERPGVMERRLERLRQ